jgi:hypothetical protein
MFNHNRKTTEANVKTKAKKFSYFGLLILISETNETKKPLFRQNNCMNLNSNFNKVKK